MWNTRMVFPATWQNQQFPQANQNIIQHVPQQHMGLVEQEPVHRLPGISQIMPNNVYGNVGQAPLNPNGLVGVNQHNLNPSNTGPRIMRPLMPQPLLEAGVRPPHPMVQNQTSPQFPRPPMNVHAALHNTIQTGGMPPVVAPSNPQLIRNPVHRVIGPHSPLLPNSANPQFLRNPMEVDQMRMRTMMPNPHILPNPHHPNVQAAPVNVTPQPTPVLRTGNILHPPANVLSTNDQFSNPHMQLEPQINLKNVSSTPTCNSLKHQMHVDSESNTPHLTTTQFPGNHHLDTPVSQGQYGNRSVLEDRTHRSAASEQKEPFSTYKNLETRDTTANDKHRQRHHDRDDSIKYGYNITVTETDSTVFSDSEEKLPRKRIERESPRDRHAKTLPYKKPEDKSPLINDDRRHEHHGTEQRSLRKRGYERQHSSLQHRRKQSKCNNICDGIDSLHGRERGSSSSEEKTRTTSISSNSSVRSDRQKDYFTSPKSRSLDRHQSSSRNNREDRPLGCVSPPPPDIKRVLKFIVPDECYKMCKSEKDSKSVTLGTEKLEQLYDTFDKKILNPPSEFSEPGIEGKSLTSMEMPKIPNDSSGKGDNDDDGIYSDFDSLDDFEFSEEKERGLYSADTFADGNESDSDEDDDGNDDVDDDASDSSSDECSSSLTGPSVKEVRARKLSDPRRLHPDLWFNEKEEGNDGPICRCSAKDKKQGIQHAVYPGEKSIPLCKPLGNNADRLYHYWVTVTPHTNFMTERPTVIKYHGRNYVFEGFSILSHHSLDKIPLCSLIRFNIEYTIHLIREPIPKNFCIKGLELFSKFLFTNILELLDWSVTGQEEVESCPMFHFMPRFVFKKADSQDGREVHELLPMNKVISHLIESSEPLLKPDHHKMSKQNERDISKSCRNLIVTRPNKKPAAFRVDDLEFDDSIQKHDERKYPVAVHYGIRPVQMSYSGNPKYQKLWKSYVKLRNMAANRPVTARKYHNRLIEMKVKLEKMRLNGSMRRDVKVRVSSQGLLKTGIHSDVCQHAMLLPVLVHHLRYHICLKTLDDKIGYRFRNRMLLQLSLSHPSYHLNFGMNPDQARNTLSNCGVKQPRYGDRKIHKIHTKKKGITQLIRVMSNLGKIEENQSIFEDRHGSLCTPQENSENPTGRQILGRKINKTIRHNERLEFLGDAVLEFICSSHLYYMLPDKTEGNLATFRSALVQNSHLALLAKRLNLSHYMQYSHGPDLCKEEDMDHAMANCFEALLGAIFLESGLQATEDFFCRVAFEDEAIRKVWLSVPKHPLQLQEPDGDRHLVSSSPVLQNLQELEESTGITFTHIRLLARAFTHSQVGFNNLTLGDNQRMEFLGDSILQFVISIYLYRHFPEHHEGHLTLLRSSLVNNRTQADIARQLGLDKYINFGSARPTNIREKVLADVLEAFLAALYVDKGLKHVEAFCRACFFPRVEDNIVNQEWIDAKSQLQQCCLTLREEGKTPDLPEYRVLQNKGPAHRKRYHIVVYYKGKRCGKGEGQSIHQAEMAAAKDALSSCYFPELARQKHLLDDKHQNKRKRYDRPPTPKEEPAENPPVQEPLWVDNEEF